MKLARSVSLATTLMLSAGTLGGQETAAQLPVTPNTKLYAKIEKTIIKIHSVFDRPLHPVISGVGPGGGWGAGLGYDAPGRGPWDFSAKAVYTLNNYWMAEAIAGYKDRRSQLEMFARGREMGRLDYYGLGPEATDSLGVVRDSPSLPISGYPSSTEYDGPNLDRFRTRVESRAGRANGPPAGRYPSQRTDDERFGGRVSAPIRWHTRSHRTPFRGPISERAAGVAVRARRPPSPNRPWRMDRPSGR